LPDLTSSPGKLELNSFLSSMLIRSGFRPVHWVFLAVGLLCLAFGVYVPFSSHLYKFSSSSSSSSSSGSDEQRGTTHLADREEADNQFPMAVIPPAVVIWLHGLGDTGPANARLQTVFTKSFMQGVKWVFPTAPTQRVSVNYGAYSQSWFDISELPVSAQAVDFEEGVLKAVSSVHSMIDKEVAEGVSVDKIFLCGFSQGGALSIASSMLYPETLAGAAVFSCWVPLNPDFIKRIPENAKKTPVLWLHGTTDPVVDFSAGKAGPPLLAHAGVNCEFKPYPGLGHYITQEELMDLQDWFGIHLQKNSSSS
jgi:predicted esterase